MTPYRIAFYEVDSITWIVIDALVDFIFAVDIFLNFFTAYFDLDDELVVSRCAIAKNYITGWFFIDFVSIFPVNLILQTKDYSSLTRIARLPKLYRLIKMAK